MTGEELSSCTCYIPERCTTNANEDSYKLVKKTLKRLPESEQTVVTLYYLGELTTKEIGKYLGVSANTVTSRLQRARKLLQKDEVRLIQEVLGGVQISENVTKNVMRQVDAMKSTPFSVRKRFLFIFSTILVIAMIVALVLKLLW